jgi:uncharacterized protein
MRPRIHAITLAVADLQRSLSFYRKLGLESPGVVGTEFPGDDVQPAGDTAVFELSGGLLLCLYPQSELAKDSALPQGPPSATAFSLGHAVATRGEVDAVLAEARTAGATITDAPHERPWGIYSGYFQDLDGHLWEVLWNPALEEV